MKQEQGNLYNLTKISSTQSGLAFLFSCLKAAVGDRRFCLESGNRGQGTGNREQGAGNREQGTGNGEQGTGSREHGTGDNVSGEE